MFIERIEHVPTAKGVGDEVMDATVFAPVRVLS